jgi:hypothetical protein
VNKYIKKANNRFVKKYYNLKSMEVISDEVVRYTFDDVKNVVVDGIEYNRAEWIR